MNREQQTAIEGALNKLRATPIDPDILTALCAPDDLNLEDHAAVEACANKLVEGHPALFKIEKTWDQMDPDSEEFRARESTFRASLAKAPDNPENEFRNLNAAVLSPEAEGALRRYLTGRGSGYDKAILKHAQAEQNRLYGGDAT